MNDSATIRQGHESHSWNSITAETHGWSSLRTRITNRYTSEWWAMAYANNPLWHMEREELSVRLLEPIGVQACLAMLKQWPADDDAIWNGGDA